MSAPFLSIIIPAYNEADRLPETLKKIRDFLDEQAFDSEVLIIENGSTDQTFHISQQFMDSDRRFCAVHLEEKGKGLAVRYGMLAASGTFRFMCDADLSMPVGEISRFLPPKLAGFEVAIGSREGQGARRYNEPVYRHLGGRAINWMIRLLALPGLNDTQCGFKCFEGDAAKTIFSRTKMAGWSFDVEALFIARLRGYRIVEVPIPWFFNPQSKLSLVKDAAHMAADMIRIRQNARRGYYD